MLGDVNGETLTFEYISAFPWENAGGTAIESATSDSDVWLLDRRLLTLGVKWRWKKEKGVEDWSVDQQLYARQLAAVRGRDGGSKAIIFGDPAGHDYGPYTDLWVS